MRSIGKPEEFLNEGSQFSCGDSPSTFSSPYFEHSGNVVTRQELRKRLWAEGVFVEFETSLNSIINRLRDALSDSAGRPRYVETLPRIGYRFIGQVEDRASAQQLHQRRLLVLPFLNLSGDPSQDYLGDALTEELIGHLASIDGQRLAVVARTSSMHYKGSRKAISAIARELSVDYVVEGSVRQGGHHVRVCVQLIDAAREDHLWAKTYDGDLGDVLQFQEQIATAVAAEIGCTIVAPAAPVVAGAA